RRGQLDDAVSVRSLKRFVGDQMRGGKPVPPKVRLEKKVAVVGGGPAGLTAARDLARLGYRVTVFEALHVLGGMLTVGIPQYRLPKSVLKEEIENILALGVDVKTGMALGRDFTISDLRAQGFDKRIGIIGGGNVAMDAARVATRLGASEVHVIYRRTRDDMPADDEEIRDATEEGVNFHFLTAPKEILKSDGQVWGVRCTRMILSDFDNTGRRRPVELKDSDYVIDVDVVIPAIGQAMDTAPLNSNGVAVTNRGTIVVDPHSMQTNLDGVFAGGDAVSGPWTVIGAIAAGGRAAKAIDRYLHGEKTLWEAPAGPLWTRPAAAEKPPYQIIEEGMHRPEMPELPVEMRRANFMEVALGYTREMAMAEARRCLRCDLEAR
ncbi:MAG: FAD-dependent oxidoreductase, partial [Bacteroidetes bacterium]|nr:FAD-dependent oxidoreductase [Bacteroidota bacterium]